MTDHELALHTNKLFWVQWLNLALLFCCAAACSGNYSLRDPLPIVWWLLGCGVLAAGRLVARQVGPRERPWLWVFLVGLVLSGPVLLWWASSANGDITFRDAYTTIREHRTMSMDPDEEEIETTRYQTVDAIFEVPVGEVKRRPVQHGESIGY
jgi:hypothetical protein